MWMCQKSRKEILRCARRAEKRSSSSSLGRKPHSRGSRKVAGPILRGAQLGLRNLLGNRRLGAGRAPLRRRQLCGIVLGTGTLGFRPQMRSEAELLEGLSNRQPRGADYGVQVEW